MAGGGQDRNSDDPFDDGGAGGDDAPAKIRPSKKEADGKRFTSRRWAMTPHVLPYMREKSYFYNARTIIGIEDVLSDLFFANTFSRHLLRLFPYVVIINSTYKTDEFRMPLVEILGYTCTGKTFNIAYAFVSREDQPTYVWILQQLSYLCGSNRPEVIATDRELNLKRAIPVVFPNVQHILCWAHVLRKCEDAAFERAQSLDVGKRFKSACTRLFHSRSERTFNARLRKMHAEWSWIDGLMLYLDYTWLRDYKESIVRAWTNKALHFGTMATNRVEFARSMLNKCVDFSVGDFVCVFKAIDSFLTDQLSEVKISLGIALNKWPTTSDDLWVFDQVKNIVSKECFYHLIVIYNDLLKNGCTEECKDQFWRVSFGLPCTHEIQASIDGKTPITPSQIHNFWKTLNWKGVVNEDPSNNIIVTSTQLTIQQLIADYNSGEMDKNTQWDIASPYNEFDNHSDMNMATPDHSDNRVVGRPRGRNMTQPTEEESRLNPLGWERCQNEFHQELDKGWGRRGRRGRGRQHADKAESIGEPLELDDEEQTDGSGSTPFSKHPHFDWGTDNVDMFMLPFIRKIVSVNRDGHCGYRALAKLLDLEQEEWPAMRKALVAEMAAHLDRYSYEINIQDKIEVVNYYGVCHNYRHWMEIPIMGFVFATLYQRPLVMLSCHYPMLCLPLIATTSEPWPEHQELNGVALVGQSNHWVPIWLVPGAPLPPVCTDWHHYHHQSVDRWDAQFRTRIDRFQFYRQRESRPRLMY